MSRARDEITAGERFAFGENWRRFLDSVTPSTIDVARSSLEEMLGTSNLEGRSFLDIGSGSGLFSLAAHQLGATVHSFDFDKESVACTTEMKRRYGHEGGPPWHVEQGSILDPDYVRGLGEFDVVYSWGVLHHTGDLWSAIENASLCVAPEGRLFIAVYNDQGTASTIWAAIKRVYNNSGALVRHVIEGAVWLSLMSRRAVAVTLRRVLRLPRQRDSRTDRGMAFKTDLADWVGGWPFEVAKPEEIFDFLSAKDFTLHRLTTRAGGYGCNEFVFVRTDTSARL